MTVKYLSNKPYIMLRGVKNMPDRDGRGPRSRSPRPSKKKGGLRRGKC